MAIIDTTLNNDGASNNTNNTLVGTEFDDVLIAGPDAPVYVPGSGNSGPKLVQDNDTLTGGLGNDIMTGGYGNDKFVFNFSVVETIVTHELLFRDGNAPSAKADYKAWSNYTSQLEAWRSALTSEHGADSNAANTFDLAVRISKDKPATQNFEGDNSFAWTAVETVVTGEGHDRILDWGNGNDELVLNGLSADATADNYWANVLTADTLDDGQTVISFNGGSITLVGVDTTLDALVAAGQLTFG